MPMGKNGRGTLRDVKCRIQGGRGSVTPRGRSRGPGAELIQSKPKQVAPGISEWINRPRQRVNNTDKLPRSFNCN